MTLQEALAYEVGAAWWTSYVSSPWLQRLAAAYLARKAMRKWERYELIRVRKAAILRAEIVEAMRGP